jgi:hypothetical protein
MDLRRLINKNGPEPLMKIMMTFQTLIYFTLFMSITCFITYLFVPFGTFFSGELLGIFMICAFIFLMLLTTLLSCVPPEVIEELKKELEERNKKKDA